MKVWGSLSLFTVSLKEVCRESMCAVVTQLWWRSLSLFTASLAGLS